MSVAPSGSDRRVALLLALAATSLAVSLQGQSPPAVAYRIVDVPSGAAVASANETVLERASLPGSAMQVAALIAGLESDALPADARVECPGFGEVDGRRLTCLHPRMRRPLTAAEALSYSCNAYFVAVGRRLPRARLDDVLIALGLPPAPSDVAMPLVATGVAASPAAPAALLRALLHVLGEPGGIAMRAETRAIVLEGLRGAAVFGTAAAFSAKGVEAYAATGTARAPDGGRQGIAIAAWPAARPTRAAVVVVSGGAGADAAARAASLASGGRGGETPVTTASRAPVPRAAPAAAPGTPAAAAVGTEPSAVTVRVGFATARGSDVRVLGLEDYVARVLAGEAAPRSSAAALEALAVTVRTFALANRGRHRRDGFDLCDQTHCQVLRAPYAAVRAAADATAGDVLVWQGAPASVYYTASCGGTGERPSNVWPGAPDPPFLPSQHDSGCAGEPRWSADITAGDLRRALEAGGLRGDVRDVRVRRRSESGRVLALVVAGMTPEELSGQSLRMLVGRTLGWHLVKSTDFDVRRIAGGYRFAGRGFGHGVGFCVIGATRRAAAGATRTALLSQYFPGLQVARVSAGLLRAPSPPPADPAVPLASGDAVTLEGGVDLPTSRTIAPRPPNVADAPARREAPPPPAPSPALAPPAGRGIVVDLPSVDERDRAYLKAVTERALAAAAARAGRAAPAAVRLVFHPTLESFTRETGEAWWASGATRGSRVDLQPYAALRERGELDAAIAHEAGHLVTAPALAGRARWVHEGAAMFAAGRIDLAEIAAARRLGPPTACPPDEAFARAASAEAARAAHEKARECFARALAANRRWDEVR